MQKLIGKSWQESWSTLTYNREYRIRAAVKRKTVLVIASYNRPELTTERIEQLAGVNCPVVVSIDAQKSGSSSPDFDTCETKFSSKVKFVKNRENLGIAMHPFKRISELFMSYDNVIWIEDDISVEKTSINYVIEMLQQRLPQDILTIGLFGFLPGKFMSRFGFNGWRKTKYFTGWGWAIQREDWNSINLIIEDQLYKLKESKIWNDMSSTEKSIMNHRFLRVIHNPQFTYDTQMTFAGFLQDKKHLLPLFRVADNQGFHDTRATNTRDKIPRWYKGSKGSIKMSKKKRLKKEICIVPEFVSSLLEFFDAVTWVGTRKLPKRVKL